MGTLHWVLTQTVSSSAAVWKGAAGCLHPSCPEASTPSIGMGDMSCSPQQREGTALTFQALHQASPLEARQLRLLHHGWKISFLCKNRAPHVPVTPRKGRGGDPYGPDRHRHGSPTASHSPKAPLGAFPASSPFTSQQLPCFGAVPGSASSLRARHGRRRPWRRGVKEEGVKMAARRHSNGAMAQGAL